MPSATGIPVLPGDGSKAPQSEPEPKSPSTTVINPSGPAAGGRSRAKTLNDLGKKVRCRIDDKIEKMRCEMKWSKWRFEAKRNFAEAYERIKLEVVPKLHPGYDSFDKGYARLKYRFTWKYFPLPLGSQYPELYFHLLYIWETIPQVTDEGRLCGVYSVLVGMYTLLSEDNHVYKPQGITTASNLVQVPLLLIEWLLNDLGTNIIMKRHALYWRMFTEIDHLMRGTSPEEAMTFPGPAVRGVEEN